MTVARRASSPGEGSRITRAAAAPERGTSGEGKVVSTFGKATISEEVLQNSIVLLSKEEVNRRKRNAQSSPETTD